jgi:serine/threonine-protein kinase
MTSEQWQQLEEWVEMALALPADERKAFVEKVCAHDPILKEELSSLLQTSEAATDHLGQMAHRLASEMQKHSSLDGTTIGAYQIIRHLGEGGMGEVYLAARKDADFEQQVALKIIRKGHIQEDLLRRFKAERQILAHLHHPNIAQLLDGGTTKDGLPFLVMEYIEGIPIIEYCDRHKLDIRQRLELFRDVCAAVQHAHQNLVIHRDIKPSNILVTSEGHVKLLDFGIAKVLSENRLSIFETQADLQMLTPAYASPEMVSGEPITTASDLYSLGILLYELLTGIHPLKKFGSQTHLETLRLIREVDPTRPSQAVQDILMRKLDKTSTKNTELDHINHEDIERNRHVKPNHLAKVLKGDLDTLVLKALKKEPLERFATANQFSEDIRRYLDGQPIWAQKDSWRYRMTKFVQRNRLAVGISAASFLLLIALSIGLILQSYQLQRTLKQVETERDKAEEISDVMTNMFNADPYSTDGINPDSVTIRQFLLQNEQTVGRELRGQPELLATVQNLLGRLNGNLGNLDKAKSLAMEAYKTRLKLFKPPHEAIAESMNELGTIVQYEGHYEEAERYFRDALAMRRALYPNGHVDVAESLNNLAVLLNEKGDEADQNEELTLDLEALAMRRKFLGENHIEVAQSLGALGVYYYFQKNWQEAERYDKEALAIRQKVLGTNHPSVANTLNNYANVLREQKKLPEAEAMIRQAIQIYSNTLGASHPRVGNSLFGLYRILRDQKNYAAAENALMQSYAIDAKSRPKDHPYLVRNRIELGKLYLLSNRLSEAEQVLNSTYQQLSQSKPVEYDDRITALLSLTDVWMKQGKNQQVQQALHNTLAALPKDATEAKQLVETQLKAANGK